jgi:hypothetical protein
MPFMTLAGGTGAVATSDRVQVRQGAAVEYQVIGTPGGGHAPERKALRAGRASIGVGMTGNPAVRTPQP